jgi:hypothetical protein
MHSFTYFIDNFRQYPVLGIVAFVIYRYLPTLIRAFQPKIRKLSFGSMSVGQSDNGGFHTRYLVGLASAGTLSIQRKDFDTPIRISFGASAKNLTCLIESVTQPAIEPEISIQGHIIVVSPLLLNQGDQVVLNIQGESLAPPSCLARVNEMREVSSLENRWWRKALINLYKTSLWGYSVGFFLLFLKIQGDIQNANTADDYQAYAAIAMVLVVLITFAARYKGAQIAHGFIPCLDLEHIENQAYKAKKMAGNEPRNLTPIGRIIMGIMGILSAGLAALGFYGRLNWLLHEWASLTLWNRLIHGLDVATLLVLVTFMLIISIVCLMPNRDDVTREKSSV